MDTLFSWIGTQDFQAISNGGVGPVCAAIKNKQFKIMPIRASILWFTYQMKSSFELPSYKYHKDGLFSYGKEFIRAPFILRFISVFDKIHFNLIKGDLSFLKNIKLYFSNLILGTTKVK